MNETHAVVQSPLNPAMTFDLYVRHIDTWWPRQGVFPYSFAPATTRPAHIRFEDELNGRLYEEFADGTVYEVGRIQEWRPPERLAYSWRDPSWTGDITITVTFTPHEAGTLVEVRDQGFAAIGQAELAAYYDIGDRQILAVFAAHCRATAELRALEQGA